MALAIYRFFGRRGVSSFLFSVLAATACHAQGLVSVELGKDGKIVGVTRSNTQNDAADLTEAELRRLATVQRMLARLGYIKALNISGKLDAETKDAVNLFARSAHIAKADPFSEEFLRAIFLAAWNRNDWPEGAADGLDLVVDKKQVREAQVALRDLGYSPGPSDGVIGPGTLTAIEVFQQERGMRVDGLLTSNIYEAIIRASSNRDIKYVGDVRVLNWTDYINPEVLLQFERESRIRVMYDVFGSLDAAADLINSAKVPYDVILKPGYGIRDMVDQDKVQSIDVEAMKNFHGIDPNINKVTTNWDPTNSYVVPYLWGTLGVIVDRDKVQHRLGEEIWSWSLLLDPSNARKLSDCGILVVDEANDVLTSMLGYVAGKKDKLTEDNVRLLSKKLTDVSPYIKVVDSERFIDRVANGEACVAVGYSGDAMQAFSEKTSKEARLNFFIPTESSIIWFDYFMLTKNANHKHEAIKFLDYLMSPKIAAENTNYVQYANAVSESKEFIDPSLLNNPAMYPPLSVLEQLRTVDPIDPILQRDVDRLWASLPKGE